MIIDIALKQLLDAQIGASVSNRIYNGFAPQDADGKAPPTPFVVFQITETDFVEDFDGVTDHAMTTVEIAVCAKTFKEAAAITKTIRTAMKSWLDPMGVFHERTGRELETAVTPPLPRITQEWTVHHFDA